MKRRNLPALVLVSVMLTLISENTLAQENVTVKISGIRSDKGQIALQVFANEKSYRESKPVSQAKFPKTSLNEGKMTVTLSIPAGVHGIALLDDENNNHKMDSNLIGIPKEGYGFSDFVHTGMSKPKFDEFKVNITGVTQVINIKLRYL